MRKNPGRWTGERILALRKKMGLSQEELSDMLECNWNSVSAWERAKSLPLGPVEALLDRIQADWLRANPEAAGGQLASG